MVARIRRLLETALYCDRLASTVAFYEQLLGTPMLRSERLVAFDAGDQTVLLLFQRGLSDTSLPAAGGMVPGHTGSGPVHVAFAIETKDLAAWTERLARMQVSVESRVTWERGGTSVYFRDPDGRSVELATPGVWPTY